VSPEGDIAPNPSPEPPDEHHGEAPNVRWSGEVPGEVRLVVPATPEFLRLARVTAAGLAGRLGFGYDEIEDLRLAVDEMCFGLIGAHAQPGSVTIRFLIHQEGLGVEGLGQFSSSDGPAGLGDLSALILTALVDEHSLSDDPEGRRFRLFKRRRSAPDQDHPQ